MSRARRRRLPKVLAAIAAVGLLVGLVAAPDADVTEAQWGDAEFVETTELSALRLQPPLLHSNAVCERGLLGLLLIGRFEVTWSWDRPESLVGETVQIVWVANGNVLSTQTVPAGPGPHTTSFGTGLLEQLIALLLGGGAEVEAYIQLPGANSWQSPMSDHFVDLNVPPLVFPITCPTVPR